MLASWEPFRLGLLGPAAIEHRKINSHEDVTFPVFVGMFPSPMEIPSCHFESFHPHGAANRCDGTVFLVLCFQCQRGAGTGNSSLVGLEAHLHWKMSY
jgi:hypothetical protein